MLTIIYQEQVVPPGPLHPLPYLYSNNPVGWPLWLTLQMTTPRLKKAVACWGTWQDVKDSWSHWEQRPGFQSGPTSEPTFQRKKTDNISVCLLPQAVLEWGTFVSTHSSPSVNLPSASPLSWAGDISSQNLTFQQRLVYFEWLFWGLNKVINARKVLGTSAL